MSNRITGRRRERFLAGRHVAVLGTVGDDGAPVLTPIWYVWRDGTFLMRTSDESVKVRNVKRDPRVTVCVQDERAPYASVTAYCTATVGPDTPGLDATVSRRYLGFVGGMFYLRQAAELVEAGPEVTIVCTPYRYATQDFGAETPLVGKVWLKLKRVLPPWL